MLCGVRFWKSKQNILCSGSKTTTPNGVMKKAVWQQIPDRASFVLLCLVSRPVDLRHTSFGSIIPQVLQQQNLYWKWKRLYPSELEGAQRHSRPLHDLLDHPYPLWACQIGNLTTQGLRNLSSPLFATVWRQCLEFLLTHGLVFEVSDERIHIFGQHLHNHRRKWALEQQQRPKA